MRDDFTDAAIGFFLRIGLMNINSDAMRPGAFLAAFFALLLLTGIFGVASAQEDAVIGKGFTGVVKSVSTANGLIAVESKGNLFQVAITDTTVINSPPDSDIGLQDLPTELGFKIAGLVDAPITDDNGFNMPETPTALKITVIPGQATRSHLRTIAGDKEAGLATAVDADGGKTSLPGLGEGVEKGQAIIVLVQKPGRNETEAKARGLIQAKTVSDRLDRMSAAASDDPIKASILSDLREKRDVAQTLGFKQIAENAEAGFSDFVLTKVESMQDDKAAREEVRAIMGGVGPGVTECALGIVGRQAMTISELSDDERKRVTEECLQPPEPPEPEPDLPPTIEIISPADGDTVSQKSVVTFTARAEDILGVESVTFNVGGTDLEPLTEVPYSVEVTIPTKISQLIVVATAKDTGGNEVSSTITLKVTRSTKLDVLITSPAETVTVISPDATAVRPSTISGANQAIAEGDTVGIRAEVTGRGVITVVFKVNGVDQTPIFAPPYAMKYQVPYTSVESAPPLTISATATDGSGGLAIDSLSVPVIRNVTTINVRIITPTVNTKAAAGDTIVIKTVTDDDSNIAFVTFSVGGKDTVKTSTPFNHTYVLPRRDTSAAAVSNIPPNVFVGTARLDGRLAPDGTKVVAWMAGSGASKLAINVTATANSGETDSASLSLPVSGAINVGETTVLNGEYVLTAAQPTGQNFAGKPIIFAIGGKDAAQTGTWEQGAATLLDLTAE